MKKVIILLVAVALVIAGGVLLGIGIDKAIKDAPKKEVKTYVIEENFNDISLKLATTDVEFVKTNEEKAKVVVQESDKEFHKVEVVDNVLKIERNNEDVKWYERVFRWDFTKISITIYLPLAQYGALTIDASTGDINIPNDFTFSTLTIELDTGDVKTEAKVNDLLKIDGSTGKKYIERCTAKEIDIKTSTGKVYLSSVAVEEDITIIGSTGDTYLTDVTCKNLTIKASTGDAELKNIVVAKHTNIKLSTGDVKFDSCDSETLNIETSTGSVKGTLLTSKIFYASSDNGSINVPHTTTGGICEIKTDTGNIKITINE